MAGSIETGVGCAGMDGYVAIGGCDKNMPGAMIAIARMNRAADSFSASDGEKVAAGRMRCQNVPGTILPGCLTANSSAAMS